MVTLKKIELEGLEEKTLEFAKAFNDAVDVIDTLQKNEPVDLTEINKKLKSLEEKGEKDYDKEIKTLKDAFVELEKKSKPAGSVEKRTLAERITDEIKSVTGASDMKGVLEYLQKNGKQEIEIKAITAIDTTANTDTIGRTNLDSVINWLPTRRNAFLPYIRVVAESTDKSVFGYMEGSYTGNAAYVGEGVGNTNSDAASAEAHFGKYAKIQAVLSVNTEVYEDIPDFANGLVNQMQLSMEKFLDDEVYTGDGLAPANVQHIKGLLAFATEFDTTDYVGTVEKANIADLVDAGKTHIATLDGSYNATHIFVNPIDLFKWRRLKDAEGQPIINQDFFGNPTISGLAIVPSKKITKNTFLMIDINVAELRTKRALQLKMGQVLANDVLNDKQSAVLMGRWQLLVRNLDQKAVVKISDVATATAAINVVTA